MSPMHNLALLHTRPAQLHHARLRGHAYLARCIDHEGLQIGYSLDPEMAEGSVLSHRQILACPLPLRLRQRLAHFGGDLREALSSGMALKLVAGFDPDTRARLVDYVRSHRHTDAGRYRFYAPVASIAPCTDTTGICLVGLWKAGALRAEQLRSGAIEELRAAAVEELSAAQNHSHGGPNGPLHAGVLKIYWDDHDQSSLARRGRKHDAVVVADALHAVLLAEREAGLKLEGLPIELLEYRPDGTPVRGRMDAAQIVERNLDYLCAHLEHEVFAGTTYYGSPSFLLTLVAALLRDAGPRAERLRGPLQRALTRWWRRLDGGEASSLDRSALGLAGAIAASCLADFACVDLRARASELLAMQRADGSWPAAPWYRMRTQALFFGNAATTTVFALSALEVLA